MNRFYDVSCFHMETTTKILWTKFDKFVVLSLSKRKKNFGRVTFFEYHFDNLHLDWRYAVLESPIHMYINFSGTLLRRKIVFRKLLQKHFVYM